jgi:hypothetical protein
MKKIISASLVVSICFPFIGLAQVCKINVAKGLKYVVETSSKTNSTAEAMGQTIENNNDTKTTTAYEITTLTDKDITLTSTITKIGMEMSMMGQSMNYDSDTKNSNSPLAKAISPIVNKTRSITLDSKGTIINQDKLELGLPEAAMAGTSFGTEHTTDLFIPALIGKELKINESFTDVATYKKDKYESRDSGTYKINAVENGIASITYSGTQKITTVLEQMGMEMNSTSNNTITTELQMDVKTGMIITKASVIAAVISIDAGGMTIPGTAKTTITTKITTAP